MKETFTAQQKEIIARKMGYEGPMQMFDEFLNSSASDFQKYAQITDKYVQRMATGGVVHMVTGGTLDAATVAGYQNAIQGMSASQIAAEAGNLGLTADQVSQVTGIPAAQITAAGYTGAGSTINADVANNVYTTSGGFQAPTPTPTPTPAATPTTTTTSTPAAATPTSVAPTTTPVYVNNATYTPGTTYAIGSTFSDGSYVNSNGHLLVPDKVDPSMYIDKGVANITSTPTTTPTTTPTATPTTTATPTATPTTTASTPVVKTPVTTATTNVSPTITADRQNLVNQYTAAMNAAQKAQTDAQAAYDANQTEETKIALDNAKAAASRANVALDTAKGYLIEKNPNQTEAALNTPTAAQDIATANRTTAVNTATGAGDITAAQAATPTGATLATQATTATAQPTLTTALAGVTGAQGTVSASDKVTAAETTPTR